jgi:hypothetical protein
VGGLEQPRRESGYGAEIERRFRPDRQPERVYVRLDRGPAKVWITWGIEYRERRSEVTQALVHTLPERDRGGVAKRPRKRVDRHRAVQLTRAVELDLRRGVGLEPAPSTVAAAPAER